MNYNASQPTGGLVAAYGYDELSGSTTADLSGNNNNGTFGSGITRTTQGKFGGALVFDGANFVTIPDAASLNLTTGMTLEAWVYPTVALSGWKGVIIKEGTSQFSYFLYANTDGNNQAVMVNIGGEQIALGGSAAPVNTWTHLAGTYDGLTLRLYINGVEVAAQPRSGQIGIFSGPIRIGGNSALGEYFQGRIDEVRIYNRALTQTEVQADMNAPLSGTPPPDTTAPAVAIASHTNNQTVTSSPITVSGTASDSGVGNNGISSVTVNGVAATGGTATGSATANWSQSVALNPGANTITVVARDASTNQNSTTVSITVSYAPPAGDTTSPTVAITSHTNNQTVTSSPVTVAGTATDSGLGNNGISSVTVNGVAATGGTATGSATANWSRSTTLSPGANTITVVARDASTNQNSTTVSITVSYTPPAGDTTGPTVAITSHTNNQTVTSSPITVAGTATDSGLGNNGISSVTVNGVAATGGTATGSATANWSRSVTLSPGANTITVVAKDASTNQNSSTSQISVNYSTIPASIAFVQGNHAVPQTPQATVTVGYAAAQTAGNLNVVAVGWNDGTATVTSVTDSKGNIYSLAVGPTVLTGQAGHAIYYASNIVGAAGNVNVVTVRFNVAAVYPDVRILEYSGLDTVSPFQTAIAASGSSATSNSGTLNVSSSNVLLVAANVVATATSGAGSGFVNRVITSPNGDIVEDRVVTTPGAYSATAPLTSSGYWIMQVVAFGATALPSDSTPPTVSMTSPVANSTVASTVTVAAEAADNINVVGVQFFLDGAPLGSEVTDSPYSVLWNTTATTPGNHSLSARARDGSGNSTDSASISVIVQTPTVADTGQWSAVANWPLVAVHSILLPTGNVLAFDGAAQNGAAYIWNPTNNTFTSKNAADNIFCAGHCLLPDGRVLVVGGHIANFVGITDANIFNPTTAAWTQIPSMSYGRWYPTAITLPDGRVLVVAGDDGCETCWVPNPRDLQPGYQYLAGVNKCRQSSTGISASICAIGRPGVSNRNV